MRILCMEILEFKSAVKEEVREGDRTIVLRLNLHQSLNFPPRDYLNYVRT